MAVDGQVVIRPVISLTATIDHRYADGWHISQLIKPFRAYLQDPSAFEPDPQPPAGDPVESNADAQQAIGERLDWVPRPDEPASNGADAAGLPAEPSAPTLGG
jgi:hypothetical protein